MNLLASFPGPQLFSEEKRGDKAGDETMNLLDVVGISPGAYLSAALFLL